MIIAKWLAPLQKAFFLIQIAEWWGKFCFIGAWQDVQNLAEIRLEKDSAYHY